MDNQRLILLVALSFVSLLLWQAWQQDYSAPSAASAQSAQDAQQHPQATPRAPPGQASNDSLPQVPSASDTRVTAVSGAGKPRAAKLIEVETDVIRAKIDLNGGQLVDLRLKDYPEELDTPDQPFQLLKYGPDGVLIAQFGLVVKEGEAVTHQQAFTARRTHYELKEGEDLLTVPLEWVSDTGLKVTKTFTFRRDSYQVGLSQRIQNDTDQPWQGSQYAQMERTGAGEGENSMLMPTYTGGAVYSQAEGYQKLTFDDLQSEKFANRPITDGWTAFIQHYFVAALIPDRGVKGYYYGHRQPTGLYTLGVATPSKTVLPGDAGEFHTLLFAGPKIQNRMAAAAGELDRAVDYGYLYVLSKPLFWLLDHIHAVVGNWGWAIIVLTILIKLAFFKLSEVGYRSMARMRKLTPRIQQLRERYADNKQRMNQAMMELYKTEKINPMGGCFPMLVQIPVFIALYYVLLESVEMRQAPWIFWIRDMSQMDEYFVLPLLMGVTMFVQQKLNPAPPDPIQAKVMMMLPFIFTVFFAFFPAGLVLYWFANNLLSIAQQWVINRRIERDG